MKYKINIGLSILSVLIALSFSFLSYSRTDKNLEYRGAVLAHIHKIGSGYGSRKSQEMHKHLITIGYDIVQINTFAYMRNRKHTEVYYNNDPTLSNNYVKEEIKNLHSAGFKVMLKPHVWIGGHELDPDNWRSKIEFSQKKKLNSWFSNYEKFITDQAVLAEELKVEIFVIGTELAGLSKYTDKWNNLIRKIRSVYSGRLTYAAEWKNAKNVNFWNSLDYIGIDAYYPLTEKNNPSVEELIDSWAKYDREFSTLYKEYGKKIIFTEIGYKSVEGTAKRPWEWSHNTKYSEEEQAAAFEALSKFFANKPYLAGVFIWKYFTDNNSDEKGNIKKGFTPYGKKAENVIIDWFR